MGSEMCIRDRPNEVLILSRSANTNSSRLGHRQMALTLNLDALFGSRSRKTLDSPRANFPISCEIGYGKSLEAHPKTGGLMKNWLRVIQSQSRSAIGLLFSLALALFARNVVQRAVLSVFTGRSNNHFISGVFGGVLVRVLPRVFRNALAGQIRSAPICLSHASG